MKKGLVELVVIIDKSGSMMELQKDVIGGFNSLIKEQAKTDNEVLVTTVLFNTYSNFLNKREDIKLIKEMSLEDYTPRGSTALLDAIGSAIEFIESEHSKLKDEFIPANTIFSIITDGYENASVEYSYPQIKKLIESKKEKGWEFLFQTANIDSKQEGNRLGISQDDINDFKATPKGVKKCYENACCYINKKINKKK